MDILSSLNLKDENGNFNPSAILNNIDKLEPMLPMLDSLMQTYKPEGSDGVFLMGSIENTEGKGSPKPILRLMGYKVEENAEGQKEIKITSNCVNKDNEPIKIDLLALIVEAGTAASKNGGSGLNEVLG